MRVFRVGVRRFSFALASMMLLSCGGDSSSGLGPPTSLTISLSPTTATVATGGSLALTATVLDQGGRVTSGQAIAWSSSNEAVATVGSGGTVQGLTPGQVTITAMVTLNGTTNSATATITVVRQATTVSVTPATGSVSAGGTLQFTVEVLDGLGVVIVEADVTWASSDQTVATVDSDGLATGVAEGTATITATSGSASGTASLEVATPLGPLDVNEDTALSGEVAVTTFNVAAGVTVTADDDFMLTASGTVSIAGTVTANCKNVAIQAVGIVTLSGSVTNPCATAPAAGEEVPGVTIVSDEAFSLQGAVISSSGDVILRSNTAATASPAGRAGAARASFDPTCFIHNSTITLSEAGSGEDGGTTGSDGGDGRSIDASCGRDRVVVSGSFLTAAMPNPPTQRSPPRPGTADPAAESRFAARWASPSRPASPSSTPVTAEKEARLRPSTQRTPKRSEETEVRPA